MPEMQRREIRDDEYVSHYGSRITGKPEFWDKPRPEDEGALSVIIGKLTPAEAHGLVRSKASVPSASDGVRLALVGDLRRNGFVVTHDPNRRNPSHALVSYPGDRDSQVTGMFNSCFDPPQWHTEDLGGVPDE